MTHQISAEHLTIQKIAEIIEGHHTLKLSTDAVKRITHCREYLDKKIAESEKPIYGVTTGFGSLCKISISNDQLSQLQINHMREIGSKFTINRMLAAECYKARMAEGLTFFEMGYMLMQSYDFLYLYNKYGCKLEIGGNDQWSNIIGGVELIRKFEKDDSFGMTFKLLTTKEGKKMGKTEKGALWLDPEKTSPYEFYQYWRNIEDESIYTVACMLTFLTMDEIKKLSSLKDEQINEAKKKIAFEITKLIHGEEEALKAEEATRALFEGNGSYENMPRVKLSNPNCSLTDAIVECKICNSKSQAKTLISQGAITLNDKKITDISYTLSSKDFETKNTILKKGKKIFFCLEK